MEFAQVYDRVEIEGMAEPLDNSGLAGVWINSNPDTNGIARMEFSEVEGKPSVRVDAIGPDAIIDWGQAPVKLFAAAKKMAK